MLESDNQKQIINRLRRVEGQLRGIQKMIAEEKTVSISLRSLVPFVQGLIVPWASLWLKIWSSALNIRMTIQKNSWKKMEQAIQMVIKK